MKKILCLLAIFVLIFTLAVPALALDDAESLGIPSPSSVWTDTGTYPYALIVRSSRGFELFIMKNPARPYSDNDDKFWTGSGSHHFYLSDGEWVELSYSNSSTGLFWSDFVWTSADIISDGVIYASYDPNFFPIPLWEKVGQVTQGEMTGLLRNLGGTLKVLVLCGVGCLASLAALSLFGKRSLIYLS